jgi:hypothetical protein
MPWLHNTQLIEHGPLSCLEGLQSIYLRYRSFIFQIRPSPLCKIYLTYNLGEPIEALHMQEKETPKLQ